MTCSLARCVILSLNPYVSARSLNREGRIFLDANESPDSPAQNLGLNRYPDPQPAKLKSRLAEIYHAHEDQVLVGRGADEAIDLIVRVFCEPNQDQVLICPPTYGMYEVSAKIQGAGILRVPLLDPDFQLDLRAITESLAISAPKVIFICSPNNPTGTAFDHQTLFTICEVALGRAIVVIDEAYAEFHVLDDGRLNSMVSEVTRFPNLIVLRTLSKAWAMAGVRCGVALAQKPLIDLLQKVRAPYPLSLPSIEAILEGIDPTQEQAMKVRVKTNQRERKNLGAQLLELSEVEKIYASVANFILVKVRNSKKIMELTRAHGIILRDRSSELGLSGCIRITVGSRSENLALIQVLKSLRGGSHEPEV